MFIFKFSAHGRIGNSTPVGWRFTLYDEGRYSFLWDVKTGVVVDPCAKPPDNSMCQLTGETLPYVLLLSDSVLKKIELDFAELAIPTVISERLTVLVDGTRTLSWPEWLRFSCPSEPYGISTDELGISLIALGKTIRAHLVSDFPTLMSTPAYHKTLIDNLVDQGLSYDRALDLSQVQIFPQ